MKRSYSQRIDSKDILQDSRLQVFQEFVSSLLRRLPEIGEYKDVEDFESLHKELLVHLSRDRRRYAEVIDEDVFLIQCGLTDELLQHLDWPGRDWWKTNLLELKVYRTRTIGDRFYRMADQLMEDKRRSDLPLAMILLDTLALGFRGRLTDSEEDEARWYQYRDGLAAWIREMSDDRDFRLCAIDAAEPLSEPESLSGIPSIRRWCVTVACLFAGMLLLSHFLWWQTVEPIREKVDAAVAKPNYVKLDNIGGDDDSKDDIGEENKPVRIVEREVSD